MENEYNDRTYTMLKVRPHTYAPPRVDSDLINGIVHLLAKYEIPLCFVDDVWAEVKKWLEVGGTLCMAPGTEVGEHNSKD
jgi:hypothetical protein